MTVAVQDVDYSTLVHKMDEAGIPGMADVLANTFEDLGSPKWQNELRYFWTALFNAAKEREIVWLWLCTQPQLEQFHPVSTVYATLAPDLPLPEIGGPDDKPFVPAERPKQWPSESTEENLRQQAEALDSYLRAEGERKPENRCKSISDYVNSFRNSGTGQMSAQMQLSSAGYHALATPEGIDWLISNYPDQEE